jgi:uncharacterized membrane protein YjfL (UPF0719 family)
VLLQLGQRVLSRGTTIAQDLSEGNAARRLPRVGQVLAVFLIAASAVKSCALGESLRHDLLWTAASSVTALILTSASGYFGTRLLLRASLPAEVDRGNVAAGVAAGAHWIATGIITSRAIAGTELRELGLSLTFFVLAQATLHIAVSLFRALTTYDDAEQIAGENLAAALSYAGVAIAVALVAAHAVDGEFTGWTSSLRGYGEVFASALILYPVRQIFVQSFLLRAPLTFRGGRIDRGIALERSVGLGVLEAVTYVATALSITHLA